MLDAETGKPVPRFKVMLDYCHAHEPTDPEVMNLGNWPSGGSTFKSADGRFKIDPLANRMPAELIITADGYERSFMPRVVAQHPDQARDLKVLLLPLHPADYSTIHGRLLDRQGKAIRTRLELIVASVQHAEPEYNGPYSAPQRSWIEQQQTGSTDSDGKFEFKSVLPEDT